ncbi:MAG: thiamine ABC transporter substrate-binding protein [Bdellovibrionales bacterium]
MNPQRLMWAVSVLAVLIFGVVFARWTWWGRAIPRDQMLIPQVVVLAYDSFTTAIGPGPALSKEFEKECKCKVQLVAAGDSGLLLEKLRMAKPNLQVDVVLGLDQLLLGSARAAQQWLPLSVDETHLDSQIHPWLTVDFVPFDWAPLTFIYRQNEIVPPQDIQDLAHERFVQSVALQDPRTSSPGLQFLFSLQHWLGAAHVNSFLKKFKNSIHSVSPSWSTAYGLFQRKQAKLAFSYVTSLVYHWTVEKDPSYQAASFAKGHPVQVEYAGVPKDCKQCELGKRFVAHLLKPQSQRLIMEKNFMLPVVKNVAHGTVYEELPKLRLFEREPLGEFEAARPGLLESWQKSLQ